MCLPINLRRIEMYYSDLSIASMYITLKHRGVALGYTVEVAVERRERSTVEAECVRFQQERTAVAARLAEAERVVRVGATERVQLEDQVTTAEARCYELEQECLALGEEVRVDAACFAYTCRRLIHLSLIAGFRQPTRARAGDRCAQCGC